MMKRRKSQQLTATPGHLAYIEKYKPVQIISQKYMVVFDLRYCSVVPTKSIVLKSPQALLPVDVCTANSWLHVERNGSVDGIEKVYLQAPRQRAIFVAPVVIQI